MFGRVGRGGHVTRSGRASPIDILLVSGVLVGAAAMVFVAVLEFTRSQTRSDPSRLEHKVGGLFPTLTGVDFAAAPSTMVVWVRSSCQYCTQSMNFYRSLLSRTPRVRVIFVASEPDSTLKEYLARHEVVPDQAISVPAGTVKLFRTPMIVQVGSNGRIQTIWVGKLVPEDEQRVIAAASVAPQPE